MDAAHLDRHAGLFDRDLLFDADRVVPPPELDERNRRPTPRGPQRPAFQTDAHAVRTVRARRPQRLEQHVQRHAYADAVVRSARAEEAGQFEQLPRLDARQDEHAAGLVLVLDERNGLPREQEERPFAGPLTGRDDALLQELHALVRERPRELHGEGHLTRAPDPIRSNTRIRVFANIGELANSNSTETPVNFCCGLVACEVCRPAFGEETSRPRAAGGTGHPPTRKRTRRSIPSIRENPRQFAAIIENPRQSVATASSEIAQRV
mmetsp:Transcript_15608/g.44457  ORF Transcript_15608/g.44457 Transcript_15608/m.44457 type:complete len:265 (-) Transcript_15608:357-1151(-)